MPASKHAERSPHWQTFRAKYLAGKVCAVCGQGKEVEAHHIIPFDVAPELELLESNLIPLCGCNHGCDCHLLFGHLGSFFSFNPSIIEDAKWMRAKIMARPDHENQQNCVKDSLLTGPSESR